MRLEKHWHSSVYRKWHARLQSQRQQGRFYGSGGQQLPADADGSIILRPTDRGISHADTDSYKITGVSHHHLPPTSPVQPDVWGRGGG